VAHRAVAVASARACRRMRPIETSDFDIDNTPRK
jgi:hypothetical protein